MYLLILATATNQRLQEVIDEAKQQGFDITLLVQKKRMNFWEQREKTISFIPTSTDFIEYKTVMKEGLINKRVYDEIWIPSSFENNINSFGEAITLALEIKPSKVFWKALGGKNIEIKQPSLREKIESTLLWMSYKWGKMMTKIQSIIMGYKW